VRFHQAQPDRHPRFEAELISCRNVLIYLGAVQKDVFPMFHYALKPGGFLMLGIGKAAAPGDLFRWWIRSTGSTPGAERPKGLSVSAAARTSRQAAQAGGARGEPVPERGPPRDVRKEVEPRASVEGTARRRGCGR